MKPFRYTCENSTSVIQRTRIKADDAEFAAIAKARKQENETVTDDAETYLHAVGDVSPDAAFLGFVQAAAADRIIEAIRQHARHCDSKRSPW